MKKILTILAIVFVLSATMLLLSCTSTEPSQQRPQIDETTTQIAVELNAKVREIDYDNRLREVVVLNDREQVDYVRVNVNLRLSPIQDRNNSYFADDVESILPIILSTLEYHNVNFSRIGFNAYNRAIEEDSTGAIRYITYDGIYGLYTDVSWGRDIEESGVRWDELRRGG